MTLPTTRSDLFIAAQEEAIPWVDSFLLREVGMPRERVATLADLPVGAACVTALEEAVVTNRPIAKGETGPPDLMGLVDLLATQQGQRNGTGKLIVIERAQGLHLQAGLLPSLEPFDLAPTLLPRWKQCSEELSAPP